jgi:wobble nucleotide-excising tRNase
MITALTLADVATYPVAGVPMGPLNVCNFIYGPNGAGKTTLSKFLSGREAESFGGCSVSWQDNRALRTDVYNRDFVQSVFGEDGKAKGVFTLGEEDKAIQGRIKALSEDIAASLKEEQGFTHNLQGSDGNGGKLAEMATAVKALKDACLAQTRKHKEEFKVALAGVMGDSDVFRARLLERRTNNNGKTCTFEDLQARARTVFAADPSTVPTLPITDLTRLTMLEKAPIFGKAIVGKEDVDIAGLISRLQNSDWVAQGVKFLAESKPQCPFCQQEIPPGLERDLADFFDESFIAETTALRTAADSYAETTTNISASMERLREMSTDYHDRVELGRLIDVFDDRLPAALLLIQRKLQSPSSVIELSGLVTALEAVNTLVSEANLKITEHNRMVANAASEKTALTADFWRYLIDVELKDALGAWDQAGNTTGKAITGLKEKIQKAKDVQAEWKKELNGLEERTTSTQPTVEKINRTLKAFHFTSFLLKPAEEAHTYVLVRANGQPAYHNLSEGEKTFITFLYFYHLARASNSTTGIEEDRVIVLDDPVSSLDSDILFVVSSLVREMAEMARGGKGPIKQVLVLTHNVYFHKEVTFAKGTGGLPKSAFWVCRKKGDLSNIVAYQNNNPVKSSYQLLWQDVRKPAGHSLTLPNTMRRIFDSYFKLLGGLDIDKACGNLVGDEKIAAHSLLSWANDGSHAVHEDLYMVPNEDQDALYLKVFRRIFDNLHQGDHYRMMMGEDFEPEVNDAAEAA